MPGHDDDDDVDDDDDDDDDDNREGRPDSGDFYLKLMRLKAEQEEHLKLVSLNLNSMLVMLMVSLNIQVEAVYLKEIAGRSSSCGSPNGGHQRKVSTCRYLWATLIW